MLVSARPLKEHPFTRGFFCQKYSDRAAHAYHPDRLTRALARSGPKGKNEFKEITNDDAFDVMLAKIREILEIDGPQAILGAYYSGNNGLLSGAYPERFFNALGATITSGGICNEGGIESLKQCFGTYSTTNPLQLVDPAAELIVIWGSDLAAHNIHAYRLVQKAREQGATLVVIDTRRTTITSEADLFIHATPCTEGIIAMLALKRIINANENDTTFVERHVIVEEGLMIQLATIDEASTLKAIEINERDIDTLAQLLIEHKHHTIFNVGYGIQKNVLGGETVKAIALLQVFLGNIGKPGCGIVYSQSGLRRDIINKLTSHISASEILGKAADIPIIELSSALESGKYKMLIVFNFNPASSLPDQSRLRTQLARDDLFVIVHDLFLTATTRYADIVIPAKAGIESNDLTWGFYMPGISINRVGPCPYPDCLSNAEFFQRLATGLGLYESTNGTLFLEDDGEIVEQCLAIAGDDVRIDIAERGYHIFVDESTVPFSDLKFPTSDTKIHASIPHMLDSNFRVLNPGEFFLITPQHERFIHSQLGETTPDSRHDFDLVYLHPRDIESNGLTNGDIVEVSDDQFTTTYILAADEMLKPGSAMLFSGGPTTDDGMKNANFFTPEKPESLGRSGSYNSGIIKISLYKLQKS